MQLRKAERQQAKLIVWLSAPSGAGKTYSALKLAHWMVGDWSKIVLIDTENGSGDLYSHLWDYNILPLEAPYSPERFIEAITECENAWMELIIIDSTTHEWEWKWWCLEINEATARSKFKGNTWSAWSDTGARHQKFIEKITGAKCHIITTVRNKTETAQIDWKIKKLGTKEIQREWFEYELTINFNIERDWHTAMASKDRTGLFIDRDPFIITEEIGKELIEWNKSGVKIKSFDEISTELFEEFYQKLWECKNIEELWNVFKSIHFRKDKFTEWNYAELISLKDDMKASLSSIEEKSDFVKEQEEAIENKKTAKKEKEEKKTDEIMEKQKTAHETIVEDPKFKQAFWENEELENNEIAKFSKKEVEVEAEYEEENIEDIESKELLSEKQLKDKRSILRVQYQTVVQMLKNDPENQDALARKDEKHAEIMKINEELVARWFDKN